MDDYDPNLAGLLPPKFDLEKYKKSAQGNVRDWFINLFLRYVAYTNNTNENLFGRAVKSGSAGLQFTLALAREDLDEKGHSVFLNGLNIKHGFSDFWDESKKFPVTPSVLGVALPIESLPEDPSWLNYSLVAVELNSSDEVILDDFKNWLIEARKHTGKQAFQKLFSEARLRRWHDARVLEYLDLTTWHKNNGMEITQGQIAEVIFPDDRTGGATERVRKTTKPLVNELMTPDFINSLSFYVSNQRRKEKQ